MIGGGKASGAMVAALDALWPADAPLEGLVLTRYHHTPPAYKARPGRIELREASHPVPDEAGLRGAADMMARVRGLSADDLVIALVSGGVSELLSLPAEGLSFAEKQAALHGVVLAIEQEYEIKLPVLMRLARAHRDGERLGIGEVDAIFSEYVKETRALACLADQL